MTTFDAVNNEIYLTITTFRFSKYCVSIGSITILL